MVKLPETSNSGEQLVPEGLGRQLLLESSEGRSSGSVPPDRSYSLLWNATWPHSRTAREQTFSLFPSIV